MGLLCHVQLSGFKLCGHAYRQNVMFNLLKNGHNVLRLLLFRRSITYTLAKRFDVAGFKDF